VPNVLTTDNLDPMWEELFPAEQARIVQLIVDKVIVGSEGLDVRLRTEGIGALARELSAPALEQAA
jgi:site-specific DNA recombinase